jgi:subtilisin family serine protease
LQQGLTPLDSYRWQVTAIDGAGAAIGESDARGFIWDGAGSPDAVVANQLLVAVHAATPSELDALVAELESRYGLRRLERAELESLGLVVVAFEPPGGRSVRDAVRALRSDERVVLAEPHFVFATQAAAGDPLLGLQYAPKLIGALLAHSRATGRGVRIAIIDSGIAADHPDLAGRIALAEDFTGAGAAAEIHGTGVAGVVAAVEGNGVGIVGIAPSADLLALRACRALDPSHPEARCAGLALARAFDYALRNGARVINLSLGGPHDALVTRLVERAETLGTLVVAAAGNQGANALPLYPAALETVVAVSAVDAKDEPYAADSRGDFVDLAAPGVEVLTTAPGARYSAQTGSSLAAAHVSAVAALVLEHRASLSPRELRALLGDTARALPADARGAFGRGRVDACRALERALGASLGCPP